MEPWREILIKEWRDGRLTLDELAERSKLNRGTIHRILDNKTEDPGFSTVAKLASAFGPTTARRVAETLITDSRPDEGTGHAESAISGAGGNARVEDYLWILLNHLRNLDGKERTSFIRTAVALLTAFEHASPAAATGTTSDDER